jgi:hypothetical protein
MFYCRLVTDPGSLNLKMCQVTPPRNEAALRNHTIPKQKLLKQNDVVGDPGKRSTKMRSQ